MDQITHDVRSSQWLKIITQCQNRPEGTTAKQWMADNGISEKSYYYWLRKFRNEYYVAAEPPVRCGESHHSGQTEPPCY